MICTLSISTKTPSGDGRVRCCRLDLLLGNNVYKCAAVADFASIGTLCIVLFLVAPLESHLDKSRQRDSQLLCYGVAFNDEVR